ncbi:MAG: IPT/TIG domain-containing protein [Bryobacteraceae bacterium]
MSVSRLGTISLLVTAMGSSCFSQVLNRNLVVNGDAEQGSAAQNATDAQVASIPGWTTSGGFSVGSYGGGSFLVAGDYGPVNRGTKFFYGGPGEARASAVQTIDVSGGVTDLDAGRVKYSLAGYLGLIGGSYDAIAQINLKAEFQDAAGVTLFTAIAAGPSTDEVNIPAGLLLRTVSGFLPANVRKVKVTIDLATGQSGGNNYAADNISLTLSTDSVFGVNLLVNGNGETAAPVGPGPVAGWNSDTEFAVGAYDDYKMPAKTDPGPTDRGNSFFQCPTSHSECHGFQRIDFSTSTKLVDAGRVSYSVSGWFGDAASYPDTAEADVTFYDAAGKAMAGGSSVGPVTQADRGNERGLWQRSATGTVPSEARSVEVNLAFHKLGPVTDNLDAYADSLTFQLDAIQITTVVNAATSQPGAAVAGEFISIYGSGLGPVAGVLARGTEKGLSGVRVTFNGIEAYLQYVSATQVNAVAPYGVGSKADVIVQYGGKTSDAFPVATTDASPGIFTQQYGGGPAWVVNDAATFNSSTNPVARGGYITFWATGQGLVDPAGLDGEIVVTPKTLRLPVKVIVGGVELQNVWAGLIYTGEIQVQGQVASGTPTGDVELLVTIGTATSRRGVTVSVK